MYTQRHNMHTQIHTRRQKITTGIARQFHISALPRLSFMTWLLLSRDTPWGCCVLGSLGTSLKHSHWKDPLVGRNCPFPPLVGPSLHTRDLVKTHLRSPGPSVGE